MLSIEDCIALCGLTEEEVLAIGHHERLTEVAAAELGNYLLRTPEGQVRIKRMIKDDIDEAIASGNLRRAVELKLALRGYVREHAACDERCGAQPCARERRAPQ